LACGRLWHDCGAHKEVARPRADRLRRLSARSPGDHREWIDASLGCVLRDRHLDVPPDHPPPHFHAQYGEHVAQIELVTLRVINGSLPSRALRLVREWARLHEPELAEDWELAQALEPLLAIEPLA